MAALSQTDPNYIAEAKFETNNGQAHSSKSKPDVPDLNEKVKR